MSPAPKIRLVEELGRYVAARGLRRAGLLWVTEDISVTGFGGYDTSELLTPPLTSIRFDAETEACICADTALRMLRGEPVSKTQLIGYRFVEGGSVL
ncbi:MAG: substrate-binding domain-containing protein [Gemmiger sp.]